MLKRLLLAFFAVFALALPAQATNGNRLRLLYIAPVSPLPSVQTVNFGVKTLVGMGGSPLGYTVPANLGVTAFLGITRVVGNDATVYCATYTACLSAGPFKIDARNMLVPAVNGAGTYAASWGTPANGPYTVTVQEYSSAGGVGPTANVSVATVPIIAAAAHIREMTSSLNAGCIANCETAVSGRHPDGCSAPPSCASFSSTTSQLSVTVGSNNSALVGGDTVYMRDAGTTTVSPNMFNPADQLYRIQPPNPATKPNWYAAGRITLVSETVDNATDANGNLQEMNGFKYGSGLYVDTTNSGNRDVPLDMTHAWCYSGIATPSNVYGQCLGFIASDVGSGIGLYYTRCESAAGIVNVAAGTPNCFKMRGGVADHNHVVRMGKAIISSDINSGFGHQVVTNNVWELGQDDFINIIGCSNTVTDNFGFNPAGNNGAHLDFTQGNGSSVACDFGEEARNILVINDFSQHQGSDPQFLFSANPSTSPINDTATLSNANVHNNLGVNVSLPGIGLSYWDKSVMNNNTFLGMVSASVTATGTVVGSTLTLSTAPNTLLYSGMPVTGAGVTGGTTVTNVSTGGNHQWDGTSAVATVSPGSQTVNVGETLTLSIIFNAGINFTAGQLVCCDTTMLNNVANVYVNYASQPGVVTLASQIIALGNSAYTAAFPNYVQGNGPVSVTNRAAAITYLTPANRLVTASPAGVVNASGTISGTTDGTVNGALTPADSSGHACWADTVTVFDNTKTCAQMGLTQAS